MQKGESRDPIMTLVLTLVTCGLYGLYWLFVTTEEVNKGLGREEYNFVKEFLLTMVTCGLWGMFWMWRFSNSIVEIEQKWGVQPKMDAPILFVTYIFGLGPFFMQTSLNNAWDNGNPGVGADSHDALME